MPRTKKSRKAAPVAVEQAIAFGLIEVAEGAPSKVKSFFPSLSCIWASIAGRLSLVYGLPDILNELKRFNFGGSVHFRPFSRYGRIGADVTFIAFGIGGSANVSLLSDGFIVSGGAEVCTPVAEVAASGCVNDLTTIGYIRRSRKELAEAEALHAAEQAKLDARNAKRRATRAKNARRARRY